VETWFLSNCIHRNALLNANNLIKKGQKMANQVEQDIKIKDEIITEPPKMWDVIFWNDAVTVMGVVVEILKSVFNKSEEEAFRLMLNIHVSGSGVVGTYLKSIAESKKEASINYAREHNYPLKVTIEPEQ